MLIHIGKRNVAFTNVLIQLAAVHEARYTQKSRHARCSHTEELIYRALEVKPFYLRVLWIKDTEIELLKISIEKWAIRSRHLSTHSVHKYFNIKAVTYVVNLERYLFKNRKFSKIKTEEFILSTISFFCSKMEERRILTAQNCLVENIKVIALKSFVTIKRLKIQE